MTTFLKSATGDITIAPDFKGSELATVPAGYWRICQSIQGFYLTPANPFELPEKIYGSLLKHVPRIKEVFAEKTHGMTVMLEGLKGSGKSLLMKYLAKDFVDNENGIVLINEGYVGPDFFAFLQSISQKKIVLTDEFDKKYRDVNERNSVLSLLDGTYPSHTMYVLTMNASSEHDSFEFFHNRPGRVFFNLKFKAVDTEAIEAYFQDNLNDKSQVLEVMAFIKRFRNFNMDMLGTLAAEINACPNLTLEEISEYLNIKPDVRLEDLYLSANVTIDGKDINNSLYRGYLSNSQLQSYIQSMQRGHTASLNIMTESATRVYLNTEGKVSYSIDPEAKTIDAYAVKTGKANNYIRSFDVYVESSDAKLERNADGNLIITQTLSLPPIFATGAEFVAAYHPDADEVEDVDVEVKIEITTESVSRFRWSA